MERSGGIENIGTETWDPDSRRLGEDLREVESGESADPRRLETREDREAEVARYRKFCEENFVEQSSELGSASSLYLEERRALSRIFPGTLVDLGRKGIIKVRAFREDGSWYDVEPDRDADS